MPRTDARDIKSIVCYACGEVGHRSNVCPKKPPKKRMAEESKRVRHLRNNDIVASCGGHQFPITLDTGESLTILPKEVVDVSNLTGISINSRCANGTSLVPEEAMVEFTVCDKKLFRRVGVVPGFPDRCDRPTIVQPEKERRTFTTRGYRQLLGP